MRIQDVDFAFELEDIYDIQTFYLLSEGNPGAYTALILLTKHWDAPSVLDLYNRLWRHRVMGWRLWYVYKIECQKDLSKLRSLDFTLFTDEYFYEKMEKTM